MIRIRIRYIIVAAATAVVSKIRVCVHTLQQGKVVLTPGPWPNPVLSGSQCIPALPRKPNAAKELLCGPSPSSQEGP